MNMHSINFIINNNNIVIKLPMQCYPLYYLLSNYVHNVHDDSL